MDYEQEIEKLEAQIEETKAQIKELRAEVEANQEVPPVWVPDEGEVYYVANDVHYRWHNDKLDKHFLKVGNLFKTKQEADDYARAINLIETIRRERFKAQGNWWPDELRCFTMSWYRLESKIDISDHGTAFTPDVFGVWRDIDALHSVTKKYKSELEWYFTEYLPSIN